MSSGYGLDNDVYEIGITSSGTDGVKDLARAVEQEEAGVRSLIDAIAAHSRVAIVDADATRRMGEEARRAAKALEDLDLKQGKLTGANRAGAISRAGLLGANIAQDVIQGGSPAFAVNNLLGAANDKGIKALAGEFVEAAGGAKLLVGAFGAIAAAAGTAFLVIDQGLLTNRLGWSDLGSVVDKLADDGATKTGRVWGETLGEIRAKVGEVVGGIAEATIGWNSAAEAVRGHKDEIDRATTALREYAKAQKAISGVRSDAQEADAAAGKEFGKDAANLGGREGLASVIDRLAAYQAGPKGDKLQDVEVNELDEKGQPTGKTTTVQKSGKQVQAEAITRDFAAAIAGDKGAQDALGRRMAAAGLDVGQAGRDEADRADAYGYAQDREREDAKRKAEAKAREDREAADDRANQAVEDVQKDLADQQKKDRRDAMEKAEKATAGTGLGGRIDDALLRGALRSGGRAGAASAEVSAQVSRELQARGLTRREADGAAADLTTRRAERLGDEANERAMEPGKLGAPDRVASSDFARSVEAGGAAQGEKLLAGVEGMKAQLAELVRLKQRGPRLGK